MPFSAQVATMKAATEVFIVVEVVLVNWNAMADAPIVFTAAVIGPRHAWFECGLEVVANVLLAGKGPKLEEIVYVLVLALQAAPQLVHDLVPEGKASVEQLLCLTLTSSFLALWLRGMLLADGLAFGTLHPVHVVLTTVLGMHASVLVFGRFGAALGTHLDFATTLPLLSKQLRTLPALVSATAANHVAHFSTDAGESCDSKC